MSLIGRPYGTVAGTHDGLVDAELALARAGDTVAIDTRDGIVAGRIVALLGARVVIAPWASVDGIARGDRVRCDTRAGAAILGTSLLGRAVDGRGLPLDGRALPRRALRTDASELSAVRDRRPCTEIFSTGIRAIDGPLAFGRGARLGLFGAPGTGKSQLLEAVVRSCDADAIVVGLVGERGREAQRWIASCDARTTIVCATGDRPAAERVRAAQLAFAHASALRERGLDVLLVVDSLARVAAASREIALGAGEMPGRGGFPPSVFVALTRLLEIAGKTSSASVTLVATVLTDGADDRDPVSDAARAALDGHLMLSERLAHRGHFPALDIAASSSRTFVDVARPGHVAAAQALRAAVAMLDATREARALGIEASEDDRNVSRAVACEPAIDAFLRQDATSSPLDRTLAQLESLARELA